MRKSILTFAVSLMVSAYASSAAAQSVKDVIGDKTGKYIYAQAYDTSAEEAYNLASAELDSRVEAYLGENRKKKYNREWRDWVKRIVNEKYGRTRVFLYISATDLEPEAQKSSLPPQKPVADKVDEAKPSEAPVAPKPADKPERIATPEPANTPETTGKNVAADSDSSKAELPEGALGDLIRNILDEKEGDSVRSLLSKARNMRVIGLFGSGDSKYVAYACLVTKGSDGIHVYSPKRKDGTRVDYRSGKAVSATDGPMLYWFLKK